MAKEKSEEVVRIVEEMKKVKVKILRGDEWQIERELVLNKEKVYALKDEELRIEIIWLHHDVPVAEYKER